MATEVKLQSLGEGVTSGDVLEIFVKPGDVIKKDQGLFELETDKATVTVPSTVSGKIVEILVKEGGTVPVGSAIMIVEVSEAAAPAAKAPTPPPPAPVAPVAPVEPPKAVTPPVAPPAPVHTEAPARPVVSPSVVTSARVEVPMTASPVTASLVDAAIGDVIPAGPAIRRFAREVGVDLSEVSGSGEGGRITREDILAVVRQANQSARSAPSTSPANPIPGTVVDPAAATPVTTTKTDLGKPGIAATDEHGPIRVERMTKIRKTIAAQMHKSWSTVPRVVNFDDADVTELEAFRQSSKDDYATRGIKLTTMPFLVKAIATALKHHPALNATIDVDNEQIIYKDYINVGIAVDSARGLVVPTIKGADKLSIPDIALALGNVAARVKNNDYSVADLRGGTFTISNLGAIGGTYSTPIVNVPEVAILLVGRSRKLPVVMENDEIRARLMMPLSLAYDHRLVDGATAARFLNDVIAYLEAPSRLLLAP